MGKIVTIRSIFSGEEFHNVEIVSEEDLPRGCDVVAYCLNEDYEYYTIYKNCVDYMLYAVKEE